jgi:hypothetical protein
MKYVPATSKLIVEEEQVVVKEEAKEIAADSN